MIAPSSSRYSSNDMVHNHYLEEAKKKTQESCKNLRPGVMPSARSQSTANGSKPKPRIDKQKSKNWPTSKTTCIMTKTVPTGKIFASSTTTVDNEPPYGSNTDITNLHDCIHTLDSSAGTSINVQEEQNLDLSAGVRFGFNPMINQNGGSTRKDNPKIRNSRVLGDYSLVLYNDEWKSFSVIINQHCGRYQTTTKESLTTEELSTTVPAATTTTATPIVIIIVDNRTEGKKLVEPMLLLHQKMVACDPKERWGLSIPEDLSTHSAAQTDTSTDGSMINRDLSMQR
ncbi:hypothetical protein Tco_1034206, partial [Tanacetum coccineum]